MNDLVGSNKEEISKLIKENNNLEGITLENNYLVDKNRKISLNNVNLLSLINSNPYGKLAIDLKNDRIDAETFFEVVEINSFIVEQNLTVSQMALNKLTNESNYDIISINHFEMLLNGQNHLSEKDRAERIIFQKYMELLSLLNNDGEEENYLTKEQDNTLKIYNNMMDQYITLNISNDFVENYLKLIKRVKEEKNRRTKLNLKKQTQSGFVNAFFVILMMLFTGILIGT